MIKPRSARCVCLLESPSGFWAGANSVNIWHCHHHAGRCRPACTPMCWWPPKTSLLPSAPGGCSLGAQIAPDQLLPHPVWYSLASGLVMPAPTRGPSSGRSRGGPQIQQSHDCVGLELAVLNSAAHRRPTRQTRLLLRYLPTLLEDMPDMAFKFAAYESLRAARLRLTRGRKATVQVRPPGLAMHAAAPDAQGEVSRID